MNARRLGKLLKCIGYSEKAFNEVYDFYFRRIVARLTPVYGRQIAEDSAQDFFMKLICGKIQNGYVPVSTAWVYVCCENIAKRKIKGNKKEIALKEEIACADDLIGNTETGVDLDSLLNCLDETSRKIVRLYYFGGYSLKEISDMLQIGYAAVRKKSSRANKKLKKLLNRRHNSYA